MALDGQDERSTCSQREIDLQNQPDALQSQVTELHKAQDATPENPELFSEVQSLKEKLGKHSELLAQSAEKALTLDRGTTTGDSIAWKTQAYAMETVILRWMPKKRHQNKQQQQGWHLTRKTPSKL
ncbi:BnaA10g08580D [Brassica napus]|uniref:BnaA10g08580D protein n=1 Tax=Brassica napus TaxID=3708 RepID=A0A078FRQ6_BRANA|nr:BnaA10g08580D [Brassica napus]